MVNGIDLDRLSANCLIQILSPVIINPVTSIFCSAKGQIKLLNPCSVLSLDPLITLRNIVASSECLLHLQPLLGFRSRHFDDYMQPRHTNLSADNMPFSQNTFHQQFIFDCSDPDVRCTGYSWFQNIFKRQTESIPSLVSDFPCRPKQYAVRTATQLLRFKTSDRQV